MRIINFGIFRGDFSELRPLRFLMNDQALASIYGWYQAAMIVALCNEPYRVIFEYNEVRLTCINWSYLGPIFFLRSEWSERCRRVMKLLSRCEKSRANAKLRKAVIVLHRELNLYHRGKITWSLRVNRTNPRIGTGIPELCQLTIVFYMQYFSTIFGSHNSGWITNPMQSRNSPQRISFTNTILRVHTLYTVLLPW
jgi:hypothetical protein